MATNKVPRVLRVTFEFHVPKGLPRDIRMARVEAAVDRLVTAVEALTPSIFPWADRVKVSYDYAYRWWEDGKELTLPPTADNAV